MWKGLYTTEVFPCEGKLVIENLHVHINGALHEQLPSTRHFVKIYLPYKAVNVFLGLLVICLIKDTVYFNFNFKV